MKAIDEVAYHAGNDLVLQKPVDELAPEAQPDVADTHDPTPSVAISEQQLGLESQMETAAVPRRR